MKLTHKAIARMAGYKVCPQKTQQGIEWFWVDDRYNDTSKGDWLAMFTSPEEAYEDCCRVCGLVEDEE